MLVIIGMTRHSTPARKAGKMEEWQTEWVSKSHIIIRAFRQRHKLSQTSLADMLGCTKEIVRLWENKSQTPKYQLYWSLKGLEVKMKNERLKDGQTNEV